MMANLILASSSPQRVALLAQIGVEAVVVPSNVDETVESGVRPSECVKMLAERKAMAVGKTHPGNVILGADTMIAIDDLVFGKPMNEGDALRMLRTLSGRVHQVYTGVCIYKFPTTLSCFVVRTDVRFGSISTELMMAYIRSGEPFGKAGAYGIQGRGSIFVDSIRGSFSNVVGLPLREVALALGEVFGSELLFRDAA